MLGMVLGLRARKMFGVRLIYSFMCLMILRILEIFTIKNILRNLGIIGLK